MGIMITILIIGIIILVGTILFDWKVLTSSYDLMAIPYIIAGVSIAVSVGFFIFVAFDVAMMDMRRANETIQRNTLARLLKEDYELSVLQTALDFNAKQKICNYKQATFAWKYLGTNGICLDTLVIPESKFTPTNNVNLTVKQ